MSAQIISASRRTDIPALHAVWLMQRVREGFVLVRNPFNAKQISRVSLRANDVAALVLWTRWPRPLRPFVDEIAERCALPLWLCTLNAYDRRLEPRRPARARVVDELHDLAQRYGAERVRWRYDPIILSPQTPASFHVDNFSRLCEQLRGATTQCHVSFVDLSYTKVKRRLQLGVNAFAVAVPSELEQRTLLSCLWQLGREQGIEVVTCSQPHLSSSQMLSPPLSSLQRELFAPTAEQKIATSAAMQERDQSKYLVRAAACIDVNWIHATHPGIDRRLKHQATRPGCLCLAAKDIGAYDTCSLGCSYCYATRSDQAGRAGCRALRLSCSLHLGR